MEINRSTEALRIVGAIYKRVSSLQDKLRSVNIKELMTSS